MYFKEDKYMHSQCLAANGWQIEMDANSILKPSTWVRYFFLLVIKFKPHIAVFIKMNEAKELTREQEAERPIAFDCEAGTLMGPACTAKRRSLIISY